MRALLLVGAVAVVGGYFLLRQPQTMTNFAAPLFPHRVPDDVTDRAVSDAITSGVAWADYWTKSLNALYESVGNMPITGPLVTCIAAPCYGTSRPQSP